MGETGKTALLLLALTFCVVFGVLTLYVIADSGFSVLSAISLLILLMLSLGLFGALKASPEEISEAARKKEPPPPDSDDAEGGDEGE